MGEKNRNLQAVGIILMSTYTVNLLNGDDLYEAYCAFDAYCNLVNCYAIVDCLTFIFMK